MVHRLAILHLMADGDTPPAQDALIVIPLIERVGGSNGIIVFLSLEARLPNTKFVGVFFQLAGTALFTSHTIIGMVGE
jgi:hypothetical protein